MGRGASGKRTSGLPRDWRAREPVKAISDEVTRYKTFAAKVEEINFDFRNVDDFLCRIERRFVKEGNHCRLEVTKKFLLERAASLREDRDLLKKAKLKMWRSPRSIETRFADEVSDTSPQREIDVDGIFQKRIAGILRTIFPRKATGVTVAVISQLIMLLYLTTELGKNQEGQLVIPRTGRVLAIADVEQRIRRKKKKRSSGIESLAP